MMMLPLVLAAALAAPSIPATASPEPSPTPNPRRVMSVRIPMPSFITPDEQLKFDIPYQIPELNWGNQRFWDPYRANRVDTKNWADSDYATLNWGGLRDAFATNGLDISLNYTADLAGNPVGGRSSGFTYCDNWTLDLEFQTEPLLGWKGGTFSIIALDRNGNNLSSRNIGNQFTVQQVYGGTGFIFYGLAYNQRFLDDRVSVKFGRMAAGDDFASSPF